MKWLADFLLAPTLIVLLFITLMRFPDHFVDNAWTKHSKTHLASQISLVSGLYLAMLGLVFRYYRNGPHWLWLSLLAFGLFTFVGYWVGKIPFKMREPWRNGNSFFLIITLTYVLGLGHSWKHCSAKLQDMNA